MTSSPRLIMFSTVPPLITKTEEDRRRNRDAVAGETSDSRSSKGKDKRRD
jgi:hypothetical protein